MKSVLVVGPHRSGTSVTTHVVSQLGLQACPPEDRMVAEREDGLPSDNPKGHWESRSLTRLNDELLDHLGGSWSAPPEPLDPQDLITRLSGFSEQAASSFRQIHPQDGWVWKDPRLCLLLPFWLDVLDSEPVLLTTVRHPLAVARSLEARDGLGPAHALALWERYTFDLLRHCAGRRVVVMQYDALVDQTGVQVRELRDRLCRLGVELDAAYCDEAARAVDPALRHHVKPTSTATSSGTHDLSTHNQARLLRLSRELGGAYERFPKLVLPKPNGAAQELLAVHRHVTRSGGHDEANGARESGWSGSQACRDRTELQALQRSELFARRYKLELLIAWQHQDDESFGIPGYCPLDDRPVEFQTDWIYAPPSVQAPWLTGDDRDLKIPNWRERLMCPYCQMNNRQRAIAEEILRSIRRRGGTPKMYLTEQVTPMFRFFDERVSEVRCTGSEFLGHDVPAGTVREGLRHENLEALGFADASFDLVVSCSVLEHVSEPLAALREMARVLRPGGEIYLEIPFDTSREQNARRARWTGEGVEHLLPAQYHGDPLSPEGALVYFDFGWEFFDQMRGFETLDWSLRVFWSLEHGHLGGAQFFFHGQDRR